MNVPFVDLKTQYLKIKDEVFVEINEVLDNTAYICGKKAKKFEEDFAKLHDVKYAVALSSGTDALHVALIALGIKHIFHVGFVIGLRRRGNELFTLLLDFSQEYIVRPGVRTDGSIGVLCNLVRNMWK